MSDPANPPATPAPAAPKKKSRKRLWIILASLVPFIVPLPMMFLGLLTGTLQALIFAILTMVYLGGAVAVEHHDEAHH